jgi:hypothetical protein
VTEGVTEDVTEDVARSLPNAWLMILPFQQEAESNWLEEIIGVEVVRVEENHVQTDQTAV